MNYFTVFWHTKENYKETKQKGLWAVCKHNEKNSA